MHGRIWEFFDVLDDLEGAFTFVDQTEPMAFNLNAFVTHGFFTVEIDDAIQTFIGHVIVVVGRIYLDRYFL